MLDLILNITMVDILSSIAIVSAVMVIWVGNPVHSVLFLVLVFISMAGVLIIYGAEFLGMLFIIVYIGAIAILFLFVVMMLPTRLTKPNITILFVICSLVIALFVGVQLLGVELTASFSTNTANASTQPLIYGGRTITPLSNIEVLASLIYTEFNSIFLIAGLILLVAMIGAIVLTTHSARYAHLTEPKRQENYLQIARDFKTTVTLKDRA
jgi:NADH-quinone oxidoreductase subunit J